MSARDRPGTQRLRRRAATTVAVAVLLVGVATAFAQSGGDFRIRRSTIDAGGGTSNGGSFALTGTIGQPDAGLAAGGGFEVRGGFWGARTEPATDDAVFRNGFEDGPG